MAIKINFDAARNPEEPTFILARKNGDKLGLLQAKNIIVSDNLEEPSEAQFKVYKYTDGILSNLWEQITDFKLVWCKEWDTWFEITVDIAEDDKTVKTIYCKKLADAELQQIMLYNIEINTDTDIERDDYENPSIIYNDSNHTESILHRITEKAPHFQIIHVDSRLATMQRTFQFNDISLYDALKEICEEIGGILITHSGSDAQGNIVRGFSIYAFNAICNNCGHEGHFTYECPICGSGDIIEGYGEDTRIFIDSDELADSIELTADREAMKNCYKLEAGDDLINATIRNYNPDGTDYMWYMGDMIKNEMPSALSEKVTEYFDLYNEYKDTHVYNITGHLVTSYNALVTKYSPYNEHLSPILSEIIGYHALMKIYYDLIDFELYLESELLPSVEIDDTSAAQELAKITSASLSGAAVADLSNVSVSLFNNTIQLLAQAIIDMRYKVDIAEGTYTIVNDRYFWSGRIKVTNYNDDEDVADSVFTNIEITDDYSSYTILKLKEELSKQKKTDYSIGGLFDMELTAFANELKKYSLSGLTRIHDACQSCVDVLIQQETSNRSLWADLDNNLYRQLYQPYYNKLLAIESEMQVRDNEIGIVAGKRDIDGNILESGLKDVILEYTDSTKNLLNFRNFLGDELWFDFLPYRREGKYSNDNYISDGLTNAELFDKTKEFLDKAEIELYKAYELQHTITTSLKNLLLMDVFKPLLSYFVVGNWLRIKIDDVVYKLRLVKYEVDFDNPESLSIELSDVIKTHDGMSERREFINQTGRVLKSYSYVKKQAYIGMMGEQKITDLTTQGINLNSVKISNTGIAPLATSPSSNNDGLKVSNTVRYNYQAAQSEQTQTWDSHGITLKAYDRATETYSPKQMKLINSSIVLTDDDWQTTKTAVGEFMYYDSLSEKYRTTYGVNAETLIGNLILGNELYLSNSNQTMLFNQNGLSISNNVNTVTISPNSTSLFTVSKGSTNIFSLDSEGNGIFNGKITTGTGLIGGWHITQTDLYAQFSIPEIEYVPQYIYDNNGYIIGEETIPVETGRYHNSYTILSSTGDVSFAAGASATTTNGETYVDPLTGAIKIYHDGTVNAKRYELVNLDGVPEITFKRLYSDTVIASIPTGYTGFVFHIEQPAAENAESYFTDNLLWLDTTTMNYYSASYDSTQNNYVWNTGIALISSPSESTHYFVASTNGWQHFTYTNNEFSLVSPNTYTRDEIDEIILTLSSERQSKILLSKSNIPGIVFSFNQNDNNGWTHSTVIDKTGIHPFANKTCFSGTQNRRWHGMYTENLDVDTLAILPSTVNMRDDLGSSWTVATLYNDGATGYGANMLIGARGNMFIGSGEAHTNLYLDSHANDPGENMFVVSDQAIFFYVNCDTIANKIGATIDNTLSFKPLTDATGNLGGANFQWDNLYAAHSPIVSSDKRIKKEIATIDKAKELIMNIEPRQFKFRTDGADRLHYGFISQQVKQVLDKYDIENCGAWACDVTPEGISLGYTRETAPDEYKVYGMRYEELIAPMVQVIQNLETRLTQLEKGIKGNEQANDFGKGRVKSKNNRTN